MSKVLMIGGVVSIVLFACLSLILCVVADLNDIEMKHTFDWCICLCFVFLVLGVTGIIFSFEV